MRLAARSRRASVQDGLALPGHFPSLVAALAPAVIDEPGDLLVKATRENVRRNIESLKTATPIFSALSMRDGLKLIGEIYRLAPGQVELIGCALDRVSRIGRGRRQRGWAAWSSLKCAVFAIDFRDRLREPASHRLSRRPRPFGERVRRRIDVAVTGVVKNKHLGHSCLLQ
jgi:hypothetical protein